MGKLRRTVVYKLPCQFSRFDERGKDVSLEYIRQQEIENPSTPDESDISIEKQLQDRYPNIRA